MNQASNPDANRLVYRIRTAITGESQGMGVATLAWQYAETIDRANDALEKVADCVSNKQLLEAVLLEQSFPRLIEAASELEASYNDSWAERCRTFHWREAARINTMLLDRVKTAIEGIEKAKEWLFREYRNAIRAKNPHDAYRIIVGLSRKYPDDSNAKEEAERHEKKLLDEAAKEIRTSLEELIPSAKPTEILARYHAIGLPLKTSNDPLIQEALVEERKQQSDKANEPAKELAPKAVSIIANENWREIEKEYLGFEYKAMIEGTRAGIDSELSSQIESLATELGRIRNQFESEISIRQAISNLKASLDKNTPVNSGVKPIRVEERIEKLKSLERQTQSTSGQIPKELQTEISEAYALAKKRKLPKFIGVAGAIAAILIVLAFVLKGQFDNSAAMELEANALAALQTAEEQGSVEVAERTLNNQQGAILQSTPESALSDQAELLGFWIETQRALESEYTLKTKQLANLVATTSPLEIQTPIEEAFAALEINRSGLAKDLGTQQDEQIAILRQQWENTVATAQREANEQVATLQREISIAVQSAGKVKSLDEFERISGAANSRIATLTELSEKEGAKALLAQSRSELESLRNKWNSLESERDRLASATELATYIEILKRIHSFDILPASEKADIEQTLRLQSAFAALKSRIALPNDIDAWQEFATSGDYQSAILELDEKESAFIDGLFDKSVFENIYISTVQYFEGAAEPQSEYKVLLVEPIAKSDSGPNQSDVRFGFRVRGYDEIGEPEPAARNMQFISRDDGSFWGFFYKPSELSPESRYYRDTIRPLTRQLKAGANRFLVLEQIGLLEKQSELAPAFRAYWEDRLFEFMSLNPWKWGSALSPTLNDKAAELRTLYPNGISENLWRSTLEQTVPTPELSEFFDSSHSDLILQEANAIANLYRESLEGEIALAGFAQADGAPFLFNSSDSDKALWTVNSLTGRIERNGGAFDLTPYAPLLNYELQVFSTEKLLEKAELSTGLNLTDERFAHLLPPIFE